jgi:hypothetical protein
LRVGAELVQLPEVALDEFPVAPLPKKSALPLVPDAVPPTMER